MGVFKLSASAVPYYRAHRMYFRLSRSSRFRVRINVLNVPPIPPTHIFLVPVVPVHLQQVVSASRPVVNGVSLVSSRCLSPFCCAASCLFAFSPRGVILPAESSDRPRQGQDKTKKRHSSPFPGPARESGGGEGRRAGPNTRVFVTVSHSVGTQPAGAGADADADFLSLVGVAPKNEEIVMMRGRGS